MIMNKNRKRFATILLSCQVTALVIPSTTAFAHTLEGDETPPVVTQSNDPNGQTPENEIVVEPADSMPPEIPPATEGTGPATPPSEPEEPPADPVDPTPNPEQPAPDEPAEPTPDPEPDEPETPEESKPDQSKPAQTPDKPALDTIKPSEPVVKEEPKAEAPKTERPVVEMVKPTIAYEEKKTESLTTSFADKGYAGNLKKAMKLDDFKTANLTSFLGNGNPFMVGQCTWFAWARFYQVYGFDSGARGNGKTNAFEIVAAHGDKFELSSTPAAGATFSMERNTLMPQYGHVGFVEAFDGEYVWISEGNVMFNGRGGNIWVHKVRWSDFRAAYPDIVFAIPKKGVCDLEESQSETQTKLVKTKPENEKKKITLKRAVRKKYPPRRTPMME